MASITSYTKAALDTKLALLSTLASPAFTGTPSLPTGTTGVTQVATDNSTKLATTAFTQAVIAALVNSSPSTLDTLKELADALGDDPNFAATTATALGLKAPLVSPVLTGTPTAPTAAAGDSSTKIATTAFVQTGKVKTINAQTGTAYTLVLTDAEKLIESLNASAQTITVPPNSAVAFPIGTILQLTQTGAGKTSLAAGVGVTINSPGGLLGCRVQWSTVTIRKRNTDIWVLSDDVG